MPRALSWGYAVAFAALAIFFAKVWMISIYGQALPFWDEWDAQGANLYLPLLQNKLTIGDLLVPHNEHRIFTGRVVWLAALGLSGQWDTVLIMIINAAIHVALFVAIARYLSPLLRREALLGFIIFVSALFIIPAGWENLLWAMQSVVYMMLLMAMLAMVALWDAPAFSLRWLFGTLLAVSSYLSMAAGALTLIPIILIRVIQFIHGERRNAREFLGVVLHCAIVVACLALIPRLEYADNAASRDILTFVSALTALVSWPLPSNILAAIFVQIPSLILFYVLATRKTANNDSRWLAFAMVAWTWGHILAFALGRGGSGVASRYLDILLLSLALNFVCLAILTTTFRLSRRNAIIALAIYGIGILAGLGTFYVRHAEGQIIYNKQETAIQREQRVRSYLDTGDINFLTVQGVSTPYPNAERLAELLNEPALRQILPHEFRGSSNSADGADQTSFRATAVKLLKSILFAIAPIMFIFCGVLALISGVFATRAARTDR